MLMAADVAELYSMATLNVPVLLPCYKYKYIAKNLLCYK